MKKTTNYGLVLYDKEDKMNITAEENSLNASMIKIDNTLKEKADNSDLPTKISELDNDKNFITNEELEGKGYLTEVPNTYKTKTENDELYQSKGNYANKDDVPTKVSELENDKNYLSSIPLEYVTDTELTEKGFATESFVANKIAEVELSGSDVDLSGLATKDELATKVDKVTGKSLIADTEIERLANVTNYNDTELRNEISSKATISDMITYVEENKDELAGKEGKSAYQIWLEQGNTGTEEEFIDSLKGKNGYTPIKGVDYSDGKDGSNGADGKDGKDGENGTDGQDGYSPTATVTQTETGATITITDKNGTTTTNITNGKDGEKGDKGDTGSKGADGYTPVKGTDYWTEEDKEEIASLVEIEKIPDYVKSEAERVANNVLTVRTGQSLVFAGFSDAHIAYSNESEISVIHAGMGLKCIREFTNLDMIAHFGDYINGGHESTKAGSKEEYKIYHKAMFEGCNGVTTVYLEGNHDANYQGGTVDGVETDDILTLDELYSFIGANNQGNHVVEYENQNRLYGYIEFPTKKIRVIYLNSSDGWKTGVTETQATWLSNTAFDLSDKSDVADWGIVLFIHIPVTFGDNAKILSAINSYNGEAEIIGIFHGHCHNFRTEKVTDKQIWQIGIPELCVGRNNEYAHSSDESYSSIFGEFDSEGNPVHYNKVSGTSEDTSFNIVTIDRANKKIYCHCFGAGYDRTIDYGDSGEVTVNYAITNNLTNVSTDNTATTIQSGNSYTANLTIDDGYELESVTVTMGGTDVTSTVYVDGVINIASVTGNIIITATAVSTSSEETTTYTNLFSSTDADFADAVRFNSAGSTTAGSGFVSGYISAVMGDTIYVRCPNGDYSSGIGYNMRNICTYKADKTVISTFYPVDTTIDADGLGFNYTIVDENTAYIRVCGNPNGNYANFIVTKNEPIE